MYKKIELKPEETLVWEIVSQCRGVAGAITREDLAARAGMRDRDVRAIVSKLVTIHDKPILSKRVCPGGYFVPVHWEEVDEEKNILEAQIHSLEARLNAVERIGMDQAGLNL